MNFKKIISLVLISATIATVCISFSGCVNNASGRTDDEGTVTDTLCEIETEIIGGDDVITLSAEPIAENADIAYNKKALKATVSSDSGTEPVDWNVTWEDKTARGNATDYVSVVPISDGSTTAIVTCIKPFTEKIIVTAMTRNTKHKATCKVSYVGIPTEIVVEPDHITKQDDEGCYLLGFEDMGVFNIKVTNPFNNVSSKYGTFTVECVPIGYVEYGDRFHDYSEDAIKYPDESIRKIPLSDFEEIIDDVRIYQNEKVIVETFLCVTSGFDEIINYDNGDSLIKNCFYRYEPGCYYAVIVTEEVSGLTTTIKIRSDSAA